MADILVVVIVVITIIHFIVFTIVDITIIHFIVVIVIVSEVVADDFPREVTFGFGVMTWAS